MEKVLMMIEHAISFEQNNLPLSVQPASAARSAAAPNAAGMKKQGKEKKPGANLVSLVFPDP